MICSECQQRLSDYLDGHLSIGEGVRIEQHLMSCQICKVVHDDLAQIIKASRALPLHAPSPVLWQRIQAQITLEAEAKPQTSESWWGQLRNRQFHLTLSFPQLAAVAAAFVFVIASTIVLTQLSTRNLSSVTGGDPNSLGNIGRPLNVPVLPEDLERQVNEYTNLVNKRKESWDPKVREIFERNMAILDMSMDECQQQLRRNQTDQVAFDMLRMAYQKKLEILQDFAAIE